MRLWDGEARRLGEDAHRVDHGAHVVERLAHPHEDDVGDAEPELPPRDRELRHDLRAAQALEQPHPARLAECAALAAPDLRAHAEAPRGALGRGRLAAAGGGHRHHLHLLLAVDAPEHVLGRLAGRGRGAICAHELERQRRRAEPQQPGAEGRRGGELPVGCDPAELPVRQKELAIAGARQHLAAAEAVADRLGERGRRVREQRLERQVVVWRRGHQRQLRRFCCVWGRGRRRRGRAKCCHCRWGHCCRFFLLFHCRLRLRRCCCRRRRRRGLDRFLAGGKKQHDCGDRSQHEEDEQPAQY